MFFFFLQRINIFSGHISRLPWLGLSKDILGFFSEANMCVAVFLISVFATSIKQGYGLFYINFESCHVLCSVSFISS